MLPTAIFSFDNPLSLPSRQTSNDVSDGLNADESSRFD
jgi:hypothetical protein